MTGIVCSMVGASFVTASAQIIRKKIGIIANGNAQISTAQSKFGGSSLYNDGVGDYIEVVNSNSFSLGTGNFTIELWWRPTSRVGSYPPVITNFNDAYSADEWGLFDRHASYSTKFMWDCYNINSGGPTLVSTTSVTNGTWYHLAIVRNGTSFTLYVNGTSEATATSSASIDSGNYKNLFLGAVNGNYSNGHTDEIRISNTARYTSNFTPSTTAFTNDANTLLLIHADGTNTSTYFDDDNGIRSKKGIIAYGNAQIDIAQSKFGGSSILLDGTGDYLIATDNNLTYWNTQPYTVEFWTRISALTSQTNDDPLIIGNTNPGGFQDYWSFGPDNSGNLTFKYYNGGNVTVKDTGTMSTGVWYHCAAVIASNTITIYLDGVNKGSASISGTPQFADYGGLNIGWGNSTQGYNGWIDEIRVSNSARYTTGFTPSTTAFTNDANTLLLIHANGTDATTYFEDDNGQRAQPGLAAYGQVQISTAQSKFGGASLVFDGNDDYITVTDMPSTASSDYTFEFWGRFDILPWNQTLGGGAYMMAATRGSTDYISIYREGSSGSQPKIQVATANKYGSFTKSGLTLAINTWYHIAVVRSSGVFKVFFDGTEMTTFTNDSGFTNSGRTEDMSFGTIGRFIDSRGSWDGYMDEIRVSNSARYTADFTPPTAPFQNDSNTLLLIHANGTNASTVFIDDNGKDITTPFA